MCELVRRHQPDATIVVGGHVASMPNLDRRVDAEFIVRGEGVRWFRRFLGEDPDRPIRHPQIATGVGTRALGGSSSSGQPIEPTATLVPSVGCPLGCNFCSTSALFGGKGKYISFYETGDELFEIMSNLEASMGIQSFFVMDENFLLHRKRALRLLELMEARDKAWSLQVFSSAKAIRSYSIDQLISIGLSWVWMGLEGKDSGYTKLDGVDTFELVRELQSHGVRVLGSTIIGLEHHKPADIERVIDHAVRHDADFHQFMLYSPSPGTPFYHDLKDRGLLKDEEEFPWCDWHGQRAFSWRHPQIKDGQETEFIVQAFRRDFEVNGPSVLRAMRTLLGGWKRHKDHPDPRVRQRFAREVKGLRKLGAAVAAATKECYRDNPTLSAKMSTLLDDLFDQFGDRARRAAEVAAPYVLEAIRAEEKQLAEGWTYEPPTFYDANDAAQRPHAEDRPQAAPCRYVTCEPPEAEPSDAALLPLEEGAPNRGTM